MLPDSWHHCYWGKYSESLLYAQYSLCIHCKWTFDIKWEYWLCVSFLLHLHHMGLLPCELLCIHSLCTAIWMHLFRSVHGRLRLSLIGVVYEASSCVYYTQAIYCWEWITYRNFVTFTLRWWFASVCLWEPQALPGGTYRWNFFALSVYLSLL